MAKAMPMFELLMIKYDSTPEWYQQAQFLAFLGVRFFRGTVFWVRF